MFGLINQVLIVLLSFSEFLATKCVSLKHGSWMTRPTLIDFDPLELNYYPFKIGLDKCSGSCNVSYNLATKICFPSRTKDVNVKVFI